MSAPLVKILHGKHMHEVEASLQALVNKHGIPDDLKMQDNGICLIILALWSNTKGGIDVV